MSLMTTHDLAFLQGVLAQYGFPPGPVDGKWGRKTSSAVKRFQAAYNGPGGWLQITGQLDEATIVAAYWMHENGGHISANFTTREFWSWRDAAAGKPCYTTREALAGAELVRTRLGQPVRIYSGHRTWKHHSIVYAQRGQTPVKGSHHLDQKGKGSSAFDISRGLNLTLEEVRSWRIFSGIGYLDESRRVTHLDQRHLFRFTTARPSKPKTWTYKE